MVLVFWYLEAEDLRRHQTKGMAIDLDEALALLEDFSICLDSPGLGFAQFRAIDRIGAENSYLAMGDGGGWNFQSA